jgi:UDP-glucose 4-epimerase
LALRRGLNRKPNLIAIPPAVIRLPLRLAGRGDIIERIDGELIVSPAKLIGKGWGGAAESTSALAEVARQSAASTASA